MGVFVPDAVYRDEVRKLNDHRAILDTNPKDMKTKEQLGWLFGVVFKIISASTGYYPHEVYQLFQEEFASYEKVGSDGKIHRFVKGLSEMSKLEASEFIDKIAVKVATDQFYKDMNIPPEPVKKGFNLK